MDANGKKSQVDAKYKVRALHKVVDITKKFLPEGILASLGLTENDRFVLAAQAVKSGIIEDMTAYAEKDPAAKGNYEYVYRSCKGFEALIHYRLAHQLIFSEIVRDLSIGNRDYLNGIARRITEEAKVLTGIDINPACKIGKGCVIDHGIGAQISTPNKYSRNTCVVGETAEIGEGFMMMNDVVIGAYEVNTGQKEGRRHPIIGNNVTVCSGARVLGNIKIGNNVLIGTHAIVCNDIPSDYKVIQNTQIQIIKKEQEDSSIRIDGLIEGNTEKTLVLGGAGFDHVELAIIDMDDYKDISGPLHIISNDGRKIVFVMPEYNHKKGKRFALRVTKADKFELYIYSRLLDGGS